MENFKMDIDRIIKRFKEFKKDTGKYFISEKELVIFFNNKFALDLEIKKDLNSLKKRYNHV